jgi:hypothetical protein
MNMRDIPNIVEGHINELLGKHKTLSEIRLAICMKCPICRSTPVGPVCDSTKWINKEDQVSDIQLPGYVRGCGCRNEAKATLEQAHCVIGKW